MNPNFIFQHNLHVQKIRNDFRDYADFCFKEFGDRVQHWVTLNEPNLSSMFGYAMGTQAPGRCSNYVGNCTEGNSATEPYLVTHHFILSHAASVKLYREKYQVIHSLAYISFCYHRLNSIHITIEVSL